MTDREPELVEDTGPEEPPPFFRSWKALYGVVVVELALLMALFYGFTIAFE